MVASPLFNEQAKRSRAQKRKILTFVFQIETIEKQIFGDSIVKLLFLVFLAPLTQSEASQQPIPKLTKAQQEDLLLNQAIQAAQNPEAKKQAKKKQKELDRIANQKKKDRETARLAKEQRLTELVLAQQQKNGRDLKRYEQELKAAQENVLAIAQRNEEREQAVKLHGEELSRIKQGTKPLPQEALEDTKAFALKTFSELEKLFAAPNRKIYPEAICSLVQKMQALFLKEELSFEELTELEKIISEIHTVKDNLCGKSTNLYDDLQAKFTTQRSVLANVKRAANDALDFSAASHKSVSQSIEETVSHLREIKERIQELEGAFILKASSVEQEYDNLLSKRKIEQPKRKKIAHQGALPVQVQKETSIVQHKEHSIVQEEIEPLSDDSIEEEDLDWDEELKKLSQEAVAAHEEFTRQKRELQKRARELESQSAVALPSKGKFQEDAFFPVNVFYGSSFKKWKRAFLQVFGHDSILEKDNGSSSFYVTSTEGVPYVNHVDSQNPEHAGKETSAAWVRSLRKLVLDSNIALR